YLKIEEANRNPAIAARTGRHHPPHPHPLPPRGGGRGGEEGHPVFLAKGTSRRNQDTGLAPGLDADRPHSKTHCNTGRKGKGKPLRIIRFSEKNTFRSMIAESTYLTRAVRHRFATMVPPSLAGLARRLRLLSENLTVSCPHLNREDCRRSRSVLTAFDS